ncbi:hypothetical protein BJ322DRAFT_1094226 [Thelephora terrestris]|uniref:FAD/NAD(P)-binding domain-containing protein n=1 Tax=Thelephora terrestris TaxID=56493 RepID=A0A9P6H3S1_9AGAM|nr:hypothetical protein BJ322DRAFT_1094226 [Thelephora terrestris]
MTKVASHPPTPSTMTSTQKDNVVVVGGGISGVTVAQGLSKKLDHRKFNLILIEPRPFHVWLPAAARMVVTSDEKFAETAVFPFDRVFAKDKGTVRQDKVVSIKTGKGEEAGELELASGETLQYRALVLATGSKWSGPIDLPDSEADFRKCVTQWREKIRAAPDIVIVGGGAVGVELSGEIRDEYPEKHITLVHGQDNLLNDTYPAKYRNRVKAGVAARNIDLMLGEFVTEFPPSGSGELVLRSGERLNAGLVVITSGPKPNTGFIGTSLGPEALTETKLVKVEKTLQLRSHPAIFAAGDIVDWKEQKQAAKANGHGPVVVANVLNLLAGKPDRKEYGGFPEIIMITNGRNGGSAYLPYLWGIVLGSFITVLVKSKGLLIWMTRAKMGY